MDKNNKRQYTRREASDYYQVFNDESGASLGRVLNMSPTGLMLIANDALPLNQVYRLRIKLPTRVLGSDHVLLIAECRWHRFNKRSEWWEHGFETTGVSPEHRQIIQQIVLQLMTGKASTDDWNKGPVKLEYVRMKKYRR